jgi:hypothetical protein
LVPRPRLVPLSRIVFFCVFTLASDRGFIPFKGAGEDLGNIRCHNEPDRSWCPEYPSLFEPCVFVYRVRTVFPEKQATNLLPFISWKSQR